MYDIDIELLLADEAILPAMSLAIMIMPFATSWCLRPQRVALMARREGLRPPRGAAPRKKGQRVRAPLDGGAKEVRMYLRTIIQICSLHSKSWTLPNDNPCSLHSQSLSRGTKQTEVDRSFEASSAQLGWEKETDSAQVQPLLQPWMASAGGGADLRSVR